MMQAVFRIAVTPSAIQPTVVSVVEMPFHALAF
jgi:hypothetical protein